MAIFGNQAQATEVVPLEEQGAEGPCSAAQARERETLPCVAPPEEREVRIDTIPAPAWFEVVD